MPEIVESSGLYRKRQASLQNLYEADYGSLEFYDREAWEKWSEKRTEENAKPLPWEITSDDRRADLSFSEAEFRHLIAEGQKIIDRWDGKK
jgi:hypothetical protein